METIKQIKNTILALQRLAQQIENPLNVPTLQENAQILQESLAELVELIEELERDSHV